MRYIFMPLRRYFDFQGRSRRMEFWMFALFLLLVAVVYNVVFLAIFLGALVSEMRSYEERSGGSDRFSEYSRYDSDDFSYEYRFNGDIPPDVLLDVIGPLGIAMVAVYFVFWLLMLIPLLAVQIRRLHDIDRSGWWIFAPAAVYILAVVSFALLFIQPDLAVTLGAVTILLTLAAIVFWLILLVFMFLEGTRGPNRFGPDPKGPPIDRTFA